MSELATEKDRKYLKFFLIINIISIGMLVSITFLLPYAEASLPHAVGIVGDFEGTFDHESIITEGEYTISGNTEQFVLTGTFDNEYHEHVNPATGKYVTSNPNCQRVHGDLVLESAEIKIIIDFEGKNCRFGLMSYVIGTYYSNEYVFTDEDEEEEDEYGYGNEYEDYEDDITGNGRITFVADHHSNFVYGEIKGIYK